jgi:PPOX class probable F420-dependent enzyme
MPGALLTPAELAFLMAARRAILATVDAKGRPRALPVCFVVDAEGGGGVRLLIPLDDKPKSIDDKHDLARVRDIERRPEVSLLVDHWDEDWSKLGWLRLHGHATVLEPDEVSLAFPEAIEQLRARYPQYASHDLESSPMISINVERAVSWAALDPA